MKSQLLGSYFRALANAIERNMRQNLETLSLTPAQGMFLHCIWMRQEVQHVDTHAKDLEQLFDIKHPTVSGILQRMEAAGFVTLEAGQDRRCKVIRLTDKAIEAHDQTAKHIAQSEARMTAGLSEEEVAQLQYLLAKVAGNLDVCHKPMTPISEKEDSISC